MTHGSSCVLNYSLADASINVRGEKWAMGQSSQTNARLYDCDGDVAEVMTFAPTPRSR